MKLKYKTFLDWNLKFSLIQVECDPVALTLWDIQKAKLKSAFRNKSGVTIQFSLEQQKDGKNKTLLRNRQNNGLEKHRKGDNEVRMEFLYKQ